MPISGFELQTLSIIIEQFSQFICIGLAVFLGIRIVEKQKAPHRPLGLWALAVLLITASLYDLLNFTSYDYYRVIFVQLSDTLFHLRFLFSISLRIALILIAVGLLRTNEWARKAVIVFGVFTIATIYWKHPFYVFENVALMAEERHLGAPVEQLIYPSFPWISMFIYVTADLIFAGILIYYFTLESVKSLYYRSHEKSH